MFKDIKSDDRTNKTNPSGLLKNSTSHLEDYRTVQASLLRRRLEVFVNSAISKYGSVDNIKQDGSSPVESNRDIDMINRLADLKTYVTIPVFTESGREISHIYTIGMWYYWGLPEIVIRFTRPLKIDKNSDFAIIIVNIIHDALFDIYRERIVNSEGSMINRLNFRDEKEKITIDLNAFNLNFVMKRVTEDDYIDIKSMFMLWFYMYYMDAETDEKGEPRLYPVYSIDIDSNRYPDICKSVIDTLVNVAIANLSNTNLDDESSISSNDELYDYQDTINNVNDLPVNEEIENLDE